MYGEVTIQNTTHVYLQIVIDFLPFTAKYTIITLNTIAGMYTAVLEARKASLVLVTEVGCKNSCQVCGLKLYRNSVENPSNDCLIKNSLKAEDIPQVYNLPATIVDLSSVLREKVQNTTSWLCGRQPWRGSQTVILEKIKLSNDKKENVEGMYEVS